MNDEQPTQPLTDAELSALRDYIERTNHVDNLRGDARRLLAEADRLRAENEQMRRNVAYAAAIVSGDAAEMLPETIAKLRAERNQLKEINNRMAEDRLRLVDERDQLIAERETDADVMRQLRAEATGTALGHLAKIERLQSQRDVLVRKLGLDWGPDEFGDLSKVPDCAEQINAVVSIHQPTAMNSWGHRTCTECDTPGYYQEWPCPTLVALGFEEQ